MRSIKSIDQALRSGKENERWAAAIAAGDLIADRPSDAWRLVLAHGESDNEDTRSAVATCVLEHLLEHHFDTFFPLLELEVKGGRLVLGDTFSTCWKFGLAERPLNAVKWDLLVEYVNRRRRSTGRQRRPPS